MKKLFLTLIIGVLTFSCSSDDSSGTSLSNTPEAKPAYDNSNFGIYKGVFVGSSGTILININNEGEIFAELVIDGNSATYTTTETVTEGSAINGLTFTNGSSSFDFYVDSNGDFAEVYNISISGHPNANIYVIKEYSDALVECFKGTFNGDDSGVFNLIISDGEIYGLAKPNSSSDSVELYGLVLSNSISGSFEGGSFTGSRNNNSISGNWENSFSESGNWSGSRKL
ncbi:hypothetical protein ACSVH2_04635 [Flavobacterium sp. RSB2_4_14]|uniref:hypothetical protein n=1 Tax=Flavobacterium sp. RSB2_4_14 TaxID=3447665 RepID=UPI003F359BE6